MRNNVVWPQRLCMRAVICIALFSAIAEFSAPAVASTASNVKITQVLVGRLQNEVYIGVSGGTPSGFACASTHPNGLHYVYLLNRPDGDAQLSGILTAYSTDRLVTIQGASACTVDSTVEDMLYIWLK